MRAEKEYCKVSVKIKQALNRTEQDSFTGLIHEQAGLIHEQAVFNRGGRYEGTNNILEGMLI
jgi:hypothetical protein